MTNISFSDTLSKCPAIANEKAFWVSLYLCRDTPRCCQQFICSLLSLPTWASLLCSVLSGCESVKLEQKEQGPGVLFFHQASTTLNHHQYTCVNESIFVAWEMNSFDKKIIHFDFKPFKWVLYTNTSFVSEMEILKITDDAFWKVGCSSSTDLESVLVPVELN